MKRLIQRAAALTAAERRETLGAEGKPQFWDRKTISCALKILQSNMLTAARGRAIVEGRQRAGDAG